MRFSSIEFTIGAVRPADLPKGGWSEIAFSGRSNVGKSSLINRLVQPEDLLSYGMIPEFVGRMPVLTTMDPLAEEDLLRILTEPRNAIIKQSQRLFAMDGVEVEFTEEALRKLVALTVRKGTGARGLRSVLEQSMMDIMYDIPSQEGTTHLEVTGEMIESGIDTYNREDEDTRRKRA